LNLKGKPHGNKAGSILLEIVQLNTNVQECDATKLNI